MLVLVESLRLAGVRTFEDDVLIRLDKINFYCISGLLSAQLASVTPKSFRRQYPFRLLSSLFPYFHHLATMADSAFKPVLLTLPSLTPPLVLEVGSSQNVQGADIDELPE